MQFCSSILSVVILPMALGFGCAGTRALEPSQQDSQRSHDAALKAEMDDCVRTRLQRHVTQPRFQGRTDVPALEFMCASASYDMSPSLAEGDQEAFRCTAFRGFKLPVSVRISKNRWGVNLRATELERRLHPEGAYGSTLFAGFPFDQWSKFLSPLGDVDAQSRSEPEGTTPDWFFEHLTATGYTAMQTSSPTINAFCKGLLDAANVNPNVPLERIDVNSLVVTPGQRSPQHCF
jgi:hypothetical protein